jgi:hypothetical protein
MSILAETHASNQEHQPTKGQTRRPWSVRWVGDVTDPTLVRTYYEVTLAAEFGAHFGSQLGGKAHQPAVAASEVEVLCAQGLIYRYQSNHPADCLGRLWRLPDQMSSPTRAPYSTLG